VVLKETSIQTSIHPPHSREGVYIKRRFVLHIVGKGGLCANL